jgi:hypothetical protein
MMPLPDILSISEKVSLSSDLARSVYTRVDGGANVLQTGAEPGPQFAIVFVRLSVWR